jgi:hypothetical protein
VDVVHGATIGTNSAIVVGLEPVGDLRVFAGRGGKVHRAAVGMLAAPPASGDHSSGAMGGDDPDWAEALLDVCEALLQVRRKTAGGSADRCGVKLRAAKHYSESKQAKCVLNPHFCLLRFLGEVLDRGCGFDESKRSFHDENLPILGSFWAGLGALAGSPSRAKGFLIFGRER